MNLWTCVCGLVVQGCGSGGAESLYADVMVGHAVNALVGRAVLLEHGCEKHHNDSLAADMGRAGVDPASFGWASVQMDGGIRKVTSRYGQQCLAVPRLWQFRVYRSAVSVFPPARRLSV